MQLSGRRAGAPAFARRPGTTRWGEGRALTCKATAVPVKSSGPADGGVEEGTEKVEVRTASASTARGLVHRYVTALRANKRQGSANTKTRSEVSGGGKKPYKQKGTGNARQGSSRTPLKVGGGVIFGPKPRDWSERMNRKEKRLAISTALQNAADNAALVCLRDFSADDFPKPSTRRFAQLLQSLGLSKNESTLVVTNQPQVQNVRLSARNLPNVTFTPASTVNAYDIVRADVVVVERSALQGMQEFYKEGGAAWRPQGAHSNNVVPGSLIPAGAAAAA